MGKPVLRIGLLAALVALTAAYVRRAGAQSTSAAPSVPAAALSGPPTVLTLITGDLVALSYTTDGRPVVAFNPAGGLQTGTGYQTLTFDSHVYVIPFDAAAYLGAPLDLSLFDVTALAAAGYAAAPLALDITASSTSAALPGIKMTAPGKARQEKGDAIIFGRALRTDRGARKQGTAGSIFAGIDRIALAGTPARPAPIGKLYTLTVKAFDRNGQKVFGNFATIYNVDDATFLATQAFFNGTLAYSVPAGNYQVTALIATPETNGDVSFSFVTSPQVAVNDKTNVVLEARRTNRVSVTVPDPTRPVIADMTIQRDPAKGLNFTNSFTAFGPTPMYISATPPVTVGQQYFYPYFRLGDASGALNRYVYDLQFEYIGGIPSNVFPTLGRGQLDARISLAPWQTGAGFTPTPLTAPSTRTEYILSQPDARSLQIVVQNDQEFAGFATDNWRALTPGQHLTA